MTRREIVLELDGVNVYYGNIHALKGVSLEVGRGEVVTLIGSQRRRQDDDAASDRGPQQAAHGDDLARRRADRRQARARDRVARRLLRRPRAVTCSRGCPCARTSRWARSRAEGTTSAKTSSASSTLFPILKERAKQAAGTLSGGEQQMLAIGRALMAQPKVLLLDEPSLGVSPVLVQRLYEALKEINEQGTTMLLVEQNANKALALAHRGYVIETGEIVLD